MRLTKYQFVTFIDYIISISFFCIILIIYYRKSYIQKKIWEWLYAKYIKMKWIFYDCWNFIKFFFFFPPKKWELVSKLIDNTRNSVFHPKALKKLEIEVLTRCFFASIFFYNIFLCKKLNTFFWEYWKIIERA